MTHDAGQARYEPVCSFCGHGQDLHDGPAGDDRESGWCRACDERLKDGSPLPMCWWFAGHERQR